MKQANERDMASPSPGVGGLAGWMLRHLRAGRRTAPRLAVLERIALAPRQTLALVEADGRRFLVATSADGTPAFQPIDAPGPQRGDAGQTPRSSRLDRNTRGREVRASW